MLEPEHSVVLLPLPVLLPSCVVLIPLGLMMPHRLQHILTESLESRDGGKTLGEAVYL